MKLNKIVAILFSLLVISAFNRVSCQSLEATLELVERGKATVADTIELDGQFVICFLLTKNKGAYSRECYFSIGQKVASYEYNRDSLLHGTNTLWYKDGTKQLEQNWTAGVLNGQRKEWDEHGNLIAYDKIKNGTRVVVRMYPTRSKYREENIVESGVITKAKEYWENGRLKFEIDFESESFEYVELDENGNKVWSGTMEFGVRVGEWLRYDPKGKVVDRVSY